MTTQLHAFQQCDHVQSHSVVYKVIENVSMASFVFSQRNHKVKAKKDKFPASITGRLQLPSQRVQTCSIGERSVTWQAMVGRHILEDIVGRVVQYVDEHYPVDKWHLGDLIAWVAQSALKYRPRICELSKCLEGPLNMIVCPKKLLPTLSHLVKLLYAARQ
ncbi:hypothetical protein TNCV_741441 [Trichonephila clavipes]|nr:hypothetical protein TNCV_741441 [Trichonephila clavipes]